MTWGQFLEFLRTPKNGPLVAALIIACMAIAVAIFQICRGIWKKSREHAPKDPEVQFLEDAFEEEKERQPTVPNYGWRDLQTDLHDGKVTFNEIWEKCGGRIPRKPVKEGKASPGPSGQDGGSSIMGASGAPGSPEEGPPDEDPPQGVNLKKLIGACPSKWKEIEPELPIWVKCCACAETRQYGYPRVCGMCGGKGYLIGRET